MLCREWKQLKRLPRNSDDPNRSAPRSSCHPLTARFAIDSYRARNARRTGPSPRLLRRETRSLEKLTKMIMALRSDMRLYGIDTKEGRERQRASVAEHYQMIEYACARDADRIGTLITKHIMEWKPLFVAALSGSSSRSA
jgi:hypothetical protein